MRERRCRGGRRQARNSSSAPPRIQLTQAIASVTFLVTLCPVSRALGLRAGASEVYWAVVEGTREAPIVRDYGKMSEPVGSTDAAALAWYRGRVLHIINTHSPSAAGVRSPEPIAPGRGESARRRLRIEGVLLESLHSSGVTAMIGALARISSRLGTGSAKKYLDAEELRGLDLSKLHPLEREAVLVGVAVLPQNE